MVDDDAGFAAGEKGVALNPAGLPGLDVAVAVVEDDAAPVHIETAVLVDRYAGGAGGLDIDLLQTIGGLQHNGLLVARGGGVGFDAAGAGGVDGGQTETEQQGEGENGDAETGQPAGEAT